MNVLGVHTVDFTESVFQQPGLWSIADICPTKIAKRGKIGRLDRTETLSHGWFAKNSLELGIMK